MIMAGGAAVTNVIEEAELMLADPLGRDNNPFHEHETGHDMGHDYAPQQVGKVESGWWVVESREAALRFQRISR
jgi:hypothetical protein